MPARLRRVPGKAGFRELRQHGRRARSGPLRVTWAPGPAELPARLAFSIGRPAGNAVARNRLRRRLRSLMADSSSSLAPGTYLLAVDPPASDLSFGELRNHLMTALTTLTALPSPAAGIESP